MASFLYRLGRLSFRRRRTVIALWLAVLAAVWAGAATLSGPTANTFSVPGTESQRAVDLLEERFPEVAAGNVSARVVLAADEGSRLDDPDAAEAVQAVLDELAEAPQVASVVDPFAAGLVNPDATVALIQVAYEVGPGDVTPEARDALEAAAETGRDAGLTVEMGGDVLDEESEDASVLIGLAVAALVLVLTFGSFVAAGLPLLTALLGVGLGVGGIAIASGFVGLSSTTPTLALMLGLAVGIDYALFVVSRYRGELAEGRDPEDAAGRAVGTAGSAVVFAGLTVVVALAALTVVGIPVITEMGLAAAGTVLVAVLIAISLLPALLGVARKRIRPRSTRRQLETGAGPAKPALGLRWGRAVARRPIPVLVAAVLGLGVVALPALDLRLGLPDGSAAAEGSTEREAYDLLSDAFGPGFNGPLTVVVDGAEDPERAAAEAGEAISGMDGVVAVSPATVNQAGDTAVFQVVPASGPSSVETQDLVTAIRDRAEGLRDDIGASISVTGQTALNIDISTTMTDALLPYLAVVVLLALALLTLVFRSVLVPLKAVLGFLLSIAATFGAVVAVFQWGWGVEAFDLAAAPILSLVPILVIGVIFGLAMDYEFFLVTRMREEHVHGAGPREAVVVGFGHGARVVTAAAAIMISVFAASMLSDDFIIAILGFAFTVAILFDASVVRMTIVPAVMALLGERAWWLPRWLDRLLPNVDIEGESLRRNLEAADRRPVEKAAV
ncbi:MMPL family transporter [Cellulomonas cellasea]|uniref:MMPL family transporter n=1 Tax=Cellulomonas cellasea TaxID=43670 RepID=UPI0025A40917|nr:MMPL family transporter [Cellulomonas cellasea]MDM8084977.1 MMPL family transporter [Cellulomonas cellasea]